MIDEVEAIKDKIDISDLISEYIKLIPAGANFRALCPFHNEKTPSMMISAEKNIFKCFGCGAGGDAFEFLMKIEGLEFPEAKKVLAKKAGVVLKNYNPKEGGKKDRLIAASEMAAKYYHYVLLNSKNAQPARDYLTDRGLDEEALIYWQIGYSPDDWSSLYMFLKKKGFSDLEMFDAGLIQKKKVGSGYYDRFRGRIMFPISDVSGNTVAFTARVSPQNEETEKMGKYINSPQTHIYDKSRIVFALDKSKANIKSADQAVIVEGQMDAITAHQNGFKNVVASSGTALTLDQFKFVKRYTNNFLFALDSDLAGQNAIDKGDSLAKALDLYVVESEDSRGRKRAYVDLDKSFNVNVRVVEIKGAKDPDELIKKDPDSWRLAVKSAKPVIEYYFDKALSGVDMSDVSGQLAAVRRLLPKVSKLNDSIEIDYWIRQLSERLGVSEEILREEMKKVSRISSSVKQSDVVRAEAVVDSVPKDYQLFSRILSLLIKYPDQLITVKDKLSTDYLYTDSVASFYNALISMDIELSDDLDFYTYIKDKLKDSNLDNRAINLLDESFLLFEKDFSSVDEKEAGSEIIKTIEFLKDDYLNKRIARLNRELQGAEKSGDQAQITALSRDLYELLKQKS
jgi:DNA primase